MLQYLHVKNLALIDEIEVEFGRGLNILTGETGAGKSIILGSVNLALGGRYTKDILRQGTRYGLVELTFSVESERQIRRLKELDGSHDKHNLGANAILGVSLAAARTAAPAPAARNRPWPRTPRTPPRAPPSASTPSPG